MPLKDIMAVNTRALNDQLERMHPAIVRALPLIDKLSERHTRLNDLIDACTRKLSYQYAREILVKHQSSVWTAALIYRLKHRVMLIPYTFTQHDLVSYRLYLVEKYDAFHQGHLHFDEQDFISFLEHRNHYYY